MLKVTEYFSVLGEVNLMAVEHLADAGTKWPVEIYL
jgi:hypothetical protein